ncbi:MAG: PadR family transcriptional regulator [Desertimonas sp.]
MASSRPPTPGGAPLPDLLLGEWACLGVLCQAPAHGFAVAARLKPDGDIGRVWTMSRSLTYRALDQLVAKGCVEVVTQEPGVAGGPRRILGPTRLGRRRFGEWLVTPARHLRDLRSELLLKLVLADIVGVPIGPLIEAQRLAVERLAAALGDPDPADVVALWRHESAQVALRFLARLDRATTGVTS